MYHRASELTPVATSPGLSPIISSSPIVGSAILAFLSLIGMVYGVNDETATNEFVGSR